MYGVNSGVPKTLVRVLVKYVAQNSELDEKSKNILFDVLDTPVSPELLPPDENGEINQKTEDIVGPYELHDFFLYYVVRFGLALKRLSFWLKMLLKVIMITKLYLNGLKTFTEDFSLSSLKGHVCLMVQRLVQLIFPQGVTGECQAMLQMFLG